MSDAGRPRMLLSAFDMAHTRDSVQIVADCGHLAWISRAGAEARAGVDAETVCMRCIDPAEITELTITPAIYASLVQEIGQPSADRAIALAQQPAIRAHLLGGGRNGQTP